ncbi:MAG: AAA family ATPase [Rhodanobacteraceae bacterium]|nr:AAA family ATPase [Rhodanobacteraceae bacterium]
MGRTAAAKNTVSAAVGSKGWLERLGLIGLSSIEAPLLAALVTQDPLLLIGAHGTAKSLLLTRVAQALGLEFRHYNASLLNFDDLVGFPLPGKDGSLAYAHTPASIWGAGAVIFDEISRCRPDIQNKLFPIIHERRVQGIALDALRYRWAAMNPPGTEDDDNGYAGSEPLDAALADRFASVIEMPPWAQFTLAQQLAVIRARDTPVRAADAQFLIDLIGRTRANLEAFPDSFADAAAQYVQTVAALLAQVGLALSPRRANLLYRGVLAVNAAALAIDPNADVSDQTLLALRSSLPQRAQGIAIPEIKLLAAHREAVRTIHLAANDPLRAILCASDPLTRLQLAVRASRLPRSEFSRIAADALAQLPHGAREAAIVHLFETGAIGRLNAAIAAQAGATYRDLALPPQFSETLHASNGRYTTWGRIKDLLSRLDPEDARAHLQANAVASLFARKQLQTPQDAEQAFAAFATTDQLMRCA